MIFNSRAGLAAVIFTLFIAFTAAAPLPTFDTRADSVTVHNRLHLDVAQSGRYAAGEGTLVRRHGKHPAAAPAAKPAPAKAAAKAPPPPGAAPPKHHMSIAAKIRHGFHKMVDGIKHAAHAVGHFIKTTGAKIVKFGMKLVATAEKVVSKAVGFIPGIGKPIAKAMELHAKGLDAISDKIHVKLPGRLEHGMRVMNKIEKVSGYVPRELADFEERMDSASFEKREDASVVLDERDWFDDDVFFL